MKIPTYFGLALALAFLAGCAAPEPDTTPVTPVVVPLKVAASADAGMPVTQSADTKQLLAVASQVGRKYGSPRTDPFALKPQERQIETNQEAERIFAASGPFEASFTPPSEVKEATPPPVEQQPYRRLAGVIIGDSVLAIIDMGNGRTELIRPGQLIPGTEWRVVSIDEEKAVLRRSGNVLPHQVTVRLESPPPGMGGSSGAGAPGGGGGFGPPSGFGGPGNGRPGMGAPGVGGPPDGE